MDEHRVEHLDEALLRVERFDKLAELHEVAAVDVGQIHSDHEDQIHSEHEKQVLHLVHEIATIVWVNM